MLFGTIVILIRNSDADDRRTALTILGTVSAFIAAAWLVPAGATYVAGSSSHAALGPWIALFVVALFYGLVP
ncbi:MAG: hypothetical protein GX576_03440, partial [Thauera phenolivorans]|nr:hypothetical protein [Thauera phenolivorans]